MSGCLDLLGQLVENRQKVLLFSSFTSVLDLLADELDKRHYSYYKLTGSTNKTKRHQLVKDFQDDDTMIFLISLKAGGTGLNLTSAQAVIHFDPWWNVSAQNQATDRAYRIGQKNNVQVFKLIMKDSIEEKILEMQSTKKDLADAFVENNTGTITKMNVSELMDLFK
jgi:SNF2 family DNA or RNA helicase